MTCRLVWTQYIIRFLCRTPQHCKDKIMRERYCTEDPLNCRFVTPCEALLGTADGLALERPRKTDLEAWSMGQRIETVVLNA